MLTIHATNVNDALPRGIDFLTRFGTVRDSRNGPVLLAPAPVTTVYYFPKERVLFSPQRDANPFFHLIESIWMLAGADDVETVARYVNRMRTFSDDGVTLWGAYGNRWRNHFEIDQLLWAIKRLKADPNDRRVVIQMWDARYDIDKADEGGKDVPCNTHIYVWVTHYGSLSLTVCCRSNDAIWGAYGANAVHFSFLQEFLAEAIGLPVGPLYQISNNFHAYLDIIQKYNIPLAGKILYPSPVPLSIDNPATFLAECSPTLTLPGFLPQNSFLREVVLPAIRAHKAYRERDFKCALYFASLINAPDWQQACTEWLQRREEAWKRAADDGVSYG